MLKLITKALIWLCEKTGRTFNITGTSDNDVYLVRYYVFRSRFFNIFIHQFLRSDRDNLHDHPWNFLTYVVSGSYMEKLAVNRDLDNIRQTYRFNDLNDSGNPVKGNTLIKRKAEDLHMVTVSRNYKFSERHQAPTTICITGRTRREWGFVVRDGEHQRWIHWKKYLGLPEETPGRG